MVLFAVLVSTTSAILPVRRLASRREEWFRTNSSCRLAIEKLADERENTLVLQLPKEKGVFHRELDTLFFLVGIKTYFLFKKSHFRKYIVYL